MIGGRPIEAAAPSTAPPRSFEIRPIGHDANDGAARSAAEADAPQANCGVARSEGHMRGRGFKHNWERREPRRGHAERDSDCRPAGAARRREAGHRELLLPRLHHRDARSHPTQLGAEPAGLWCGDHELHDSEERSDHRHRSRDFERQPDSGSGLAARAHEYADARATAVGVSRTQLPVHLTFNYEREDRAKKNPVRISSRRRVPRGGGLLAAQNPAREPAASSAARPIGNQRVDYRRRRRASALCRS